MIKVEVIDDGVLELVFTDDDLKTVDRIYATTGVTIDDYVETVLVIAFREVNGV